MKDLADALESNSFPRLQASAENVMECFMNTMEAAEAMYEMDGIDKESFN